MTEQPSLSGGLSSHETENFAALLEESFGKAESLEGRVIKGKVISIENDVAIIDVGLKSEGRIPLREFSASGTEPHLNVGDSVEVYLERLEDKNGETVLSYEKARREAAWKQLEKSHEKNEHVEGVIFGRVKGGFTVDLKGAIAFLPGSQVDIRPVRDVSPLIGVPQPFQILKMDRSRGNIVVSRRAVLEETRAEARSELVSRLEEGQILEGIVKNITDYGAFIDLGGVDGLLHVTDIAWHRVNHPAEVLTVGQPVKVQIIRFNPENQRISLGMKQLESDPWAGAEVKYSVGAKVTGRVTNITDYGAFIELEPGVEGLVHVTEMSWTKKNMPPGKIVSTSQEVDVIVLDVDASKRRISLGMKQCIPNPWAALQEKYTVGSEIEGEVKNITEFGLFVGLTNDIDGMVHMSDISWDKLGEEAISAYKKGIKVRAKILDIDPEKERVSLGIKQLMGDPFEESIAGLKKGSVVTCEVISILETGVEVSLAGGISGFIRKNELSRDRAEQRPDRFAVGEKVDAKITQIDRANRKITLSIKAREADEERQAMAEYGSTDSGASLGDILGAALEQVKEKSKVAEVPAEELPKKAKKKADDEDKASDAKPKKTKKVVKEKTTED
ncbi:MAG: 30S ribosomal protein S1 [Alphaproteobacteria bacterium]|jgi:small subunit ribosomal protein S1|nr:30S ribosomal protein S1 [Alphaproteobacteria bacterium]MBP7729681.1 30S ribosomal protein S1 [Alphaproteobacteria bacterium]